MVSVKKKISTLNYVHIFKIVFKMSTLLIIEWQLYCHDITSVIQFCLVNLKILIIVWINNYIKLYIVNFPNLKILVV